MRYVICLRVSKISPRTFRNLIVFKLVLNCMSVFIYRKSSFLIWCRIWKCWLQLFCLLIDFFHYSFRCSYRELVCSHKPTQLVISAGCAGTGMLSQANIYREGVRDRVEKNVNKKWMEQHPFPLEHSVSNKQPSLISSTSKIEKSKKNATYTQVRSADLLLKRRDVIVWPRKPGLDVYTSMAAMFLPCWNTSIKSFPLPVFRQCIMGYALQKSEHELSNLRHYWIFVSSSRLATFYLPFFLFL